MRTGVNLYPPSDPTVVEREALVPSLVSVTVAPPITAPEASVTVPVMLPVSTWAWTGLELKSIMPAAIANTVCRIQDETAFRFITSLPKASRLALNVFPRLNVNVYIQTGTTLVQVLRTCQEQTNVFVLVNRMRPLAWVLGSFFLLNWCSCGPGNFPIWINLSPVLTCARWAITARSVQWRATNTKIPLFLGRTFSRRTFSRRTFLRGMRWAPVLFLPAPMLGSHFRSCLPPAPADQNSPFPFV